MSVDIRLPNISGQSEKEQLSQIRRYLYGLAEQLNFALNTIEKGVTENVNVINNSVTASAPLTEAEAQNNFNSIKSLIIKSADIVTAYYEEINSRLVGQYATQSEFGEYTEKTERLITENSQFEKQYYSNQQMIQSALDEIGKKVSLSEGYIKTGELFKDADGNPVYGVEVGQRNTEDGQETKRQYARFLGDRLSFYDINDSEVAYISNYKLYIINAEVNESLTVHGPIYLPGFMIDTSDGLAILPLIDK